MNAFHIIIYVDDQESSARFYREVLGAPHASTYLA